MSRTDSVFLVVCAALVACAAAYYWSPSGPRYYPLEHTWRAKKEQGKPSMGWYWRSGWAFGVAAAAAACTAVALRAVSGPGKADSAAELPAWVYGLLTLVVLFALVAVSARIVDHCFTAWDTWQPWTMPQ